MYDNGNQTDRYPKSISAQEIACFAYCPEQWRLQYGLGLPAENRADAGNRHHARWAVAERVADGSITLGRLLAVVALLVVIVLLVLAR